MERVSQVALAGESTPPHTVTPVWEWRRLREGRSGRKQILDGAIGVEELCSCAGNVPGLTARYQDH